MYVATESDRIWLRNAQRKLYTQSQSDPNFVFRKLWGLITDHRNLRLALARVARNKGHRTAGVDGITVRRALCQGIDQFVEDLRRELRTGTYRPSPTRRVLIPKQGQPGKYRALGIPTVKDRVVQAATKNVLEPIFEADFFPTSYGFRPGRSVHGAIAHLHLLLRPPSGRKAEYGSPYQWAIEGDIKGCFDNIDHHVLMERVRRRVGDRKTARLVGAFLKAGVLSEEQFSRTDVGTPQGGILSPLLANIALGILDERYERHAWPRCTPTLETEPKRIWARANQRRQTDRRRRLPVLYPIRYADDFVILVGAPPGPQQDQRAREIAEREKQALAEMLRERLGLELAETKTLITPVTSSLRFLGHHIRIRHDRRRRQAIVTAVIPKDRSKRLRQIIKTVFRRATVGTTLGDRLRMLNPRLRGWVNFYRHAWGAKRVFQHVDHYVWWTILRWLKKKHHRAPMARLAAIYGWHQSNGRMLRWKDGAMKPFAAASVRVKPYRLAWDKTTDFAVDTTESPVRNESRTPGSAGGARKPAGESQ